VTACSTPLSWETLVAYWARDLEPDAEAALEEHVTGCATCTALSEQVAGITEPLRSMLPPVITADRLRRLAALGKPFQETRLAPGERRTVRFPPGVDISIHRLGGLALADAERVSLEVRVESSGRVIIAMADAPFDREDGAVLIACQRHFESYPPDILFSVRAFFKSGGETQSEYVVLHEF
jgi:hypothetical protein